jgi:hypothetical protein
MYSGAPHLAQPTATDNCDLTPTLTYNQTAGPQNACTQVIYRTWTATDDCGNSTARTQTITVTDYTAPVLAGIPADITIQCDEPLPAPATPTATDNCDQNVTISYNQTVQTIGCTNIYTRTWTATDDCGNSTARSQTITTIDTEAPVITFINPALIGAENGDTLYFDCVYGPNLGINDITITDNCDDNPTGTFLEGTITQGDCIEDGYIVEMHCGWSVTDNCGNSTQLWVVIRVTDSIPPVISAPPADITLHCYETIPPVATLTATDLCDDQRHGDVQPDITDQRMYADIDTHLDGNGRLWQYGCGDTDDHFHRRQRTGTGRCSGQYHGGMQRGSLHLL